MSESRPLVPIAGAELDRLLDALMVEFVRLSECLVGEGYRLELGGVDAPGLHYNLSGTGRLVVANREPIPLRPHTLVVLPAKTLFRIELPSERDGRTTWKTVDGRSQLFAQGAVRRYVATDAEPVVVLICGYFHASYGVSTDLFGTLKGPIIEQFTEGDQVDETLKAALMELVAQAAEQLGSTTMTVDEIARQAGYASRSSFVRAFRTAYGCDPTSYRRSHGELTR
ncbi:MAG: helix-turn-helix transcriptional regulator [Gemmatimonadaceae bacterium]|nr:helix-turn-helix transcriptional regulator [Gemmatimonadaceae bacterium]NUS96741.1 helix-turn-helix transcriptional regulator [Gemmatimonadaceae bacterium]